MSEAQLEAKMCKDCGLLRPALLFSKDKSKKCGLATYCKDCQKIRKQKHYWSNPDQSRKSSNDWYKRNKERSLSACKRWRSENRDRRLNRRRERYKERMASDVNFRLDLIMRASIARLVNFGGYSQKLDYTAEKLKARIECQFKSGMSWDNYGDWEIDHKIPMSMFISRGELRPHIINALSNLQPMWKFDNRSKGARYVG